jgi:hypothetical protein
MIRFWRRITAAVALALLMVWTLATGVASAQEGGGLVPSFGDGTLTIAGDGFKPGEVVTITAQVGGTTHQLMATADAQGQFRLETDIAVPPGASVQLESRGDQGTVKAATTTAPGQLPRTAGASPLLVPAALIGLALVGAGLMLKGRGD